MKPNIEKSSAFKIDCFIILVAIDTLITQRAKTAPWIEDGAEVLAKIVAVILVIPIASILGFFTVEPDRVVV
ncbi:hypothetical protein [Chamaesiphon polymorphus]|uniref:Uncharacterized protein n=1 Tax=Chamaesiphon polymorphus CCALA 037 TaxID=2107692 RepID=A0A2T1F4P3_9CYAN|nr:hypothetical protein [Chamaesiphon polymorphus]PSB39908.1 hypothetical protein C7B77_28900 [Chamaesiphon polymorphus CCALA 037]